MSLVTALLMSLNLVSTSTPDCGCGPAVTPSPVVMPMAGDAVQTVTAETTESTQNADILSATAGPFGSYAAAADYADFLEIEYGFFTRVVRSGGWYYVIYW